VSLADQLAAATPKPQPAHPAGWTPGLTYGAQGGELVTLVTDASDADPAFWQMVIADWGLDPTLTEIVPDSVQIRAWDMPIGGGQVMRARYYKARIRPRRAAMTEADILATSRLAMRKPTKRTSPSSTQQLGYIVNLSDFQIGKGEGGGTPATVARITAALHAAVDRLKELRRAGKSPATVYLIGMGDLAEQCFGHYPSQLFTTDCTRREQLQIVRELLLTAVDLFLPLADRLVVGAVAGNHGENRSNGKAVTTVADNDDLAVFDQVKSALAMNPDRYGHVEFAISDDLVLKLTVHGVDVAWTHMHQGSGSGERKIADWWRGQVMGNRPISSAQILNTAHYHHFLCSESTGRTIIQVPAMDGGSAWWTDKTGQNSPPGMVTYLAGSDCGARGWSDLLIIGCDHVNEESCKETKA
jgi:hypothetical protein